MPYILSSGVITNDVLSYIEDYFLCEFTIIPGEVPNSPNIGSPLLIDEPTLESAKRKLNSIVSTTIGKIQKQFPSLTITLDSIDIVNDLITINIDINNTIKSYAITRTDNLGS